MKKLYQNPTRYQVRKGVILPIYLNYKEQKDLLGYAKLIERVKCITPCLPFLRAEVGGNGKKEADGIIWGSRNYKVEFVDPWEYDKKLSKEHRDKYIHQKGFITNKKIGYFIKVASYNLYRLE